MAIGLGRMIGFRFKENFDHPYESKTITEFWRRWHISLGSFFRDYLYIPLGGNRKRAVFNILIVWMLTGLWHGASLNFVLWGMYFGVVLLIEKYVLRRILEKIPTIFAHMYAIMLVLFGWLIFYFTDFNVLAAYAAAFWGVATSWTDYRTTDLFFANLWILPVFALFSTKIPSRLLQKLKTRLPVSEPVINLATLCIGFVVLIGQSFNPFLYFRF
jgi:alginate O-acetyltransferase complex protein AlgI